MATQQAPYMTRRRFVALSSVAGASLITGLVGCASEETTEAPGQTLEDVSAPEELLATEQGEAPDEPSPSTPEPESEPVASTQDAPQVYFVRTVDPEALQTVFDALGRSISGSNIGVKLSSGEPGGHNFLDPALIVDLVTSLNATIVECNTAYGGKRMKTESHYQAAEDHGFTGIAPFQIMDEDGSVTLPVNGGLRIPKNYVGAHFPEYDGFLVLSHFKGHAMAGFGGALKNLSIGMASTEGKCVIHSAGQSHTRMMGFETAAFQESMADACKSVVDALDGNLLYVNVMNNLSVDCDCDSNPAPPKMADIGVLASIDPVALDQACLDLIYASDDDSADLIKRIESKNGAHVLEAAESIGVGSRAYELVELG